MEPILRATENLDWITLLVFCSLIFLVVAKSLFYARFLNFIILPFNNKYIFMYNKKDKLVNLFNIFFTAFQIINISVFIYLAVNILWQKTGLSASFLFFIILAGWLLFLVLKILFQLGGGFIFGSGKTIGELIFKKLSYLNYSSLIVFVANIILLYIGKNSEIVVYSAILLVLLINIIGWVTLLRNHQKFLAYNFFYFILYLCALEIAPLVIIGSYLKD